MSQAGASNETHISFISMRTTSLDWANVTITATTPPGAPAALTPSPTAYLRMDPILYNLPLRVVRTVLPGAHCTALHMLLTHA